MPELPEVETVVRDLQSSALVGRRVARVWTDWPRMLAPLGSRQFARRLKGECLREIARRGKFILLRFDAQTLLLHLRMSGRINIASADIPRSPYEHLLLVFDDGRELRFHDTRKFGRAFLTESEDDVLGGLGVEPLGPQFSLAWLRAALPRRARMLKPLLLDQSFIAGLGNIYVDEALWDARLHPCRRADTLDDDEIKALRRAIPKVLKRGIRNCGTSLGTGHGNYTSLAGRRGGNQNELNVYGRGGQDCPRCGAEIAKMLVAQRGTHICPDCQPESGKMAGMDD
jgi:formamidopyrimidine-DNA glycosylase